MPALIYRANDVRELDRRAIKEHDLPGIELMTRAGEAAWHLLCATWPRARRIAVVCGPGNNGGDGYVVARLARVAGRDVSALQVADVRTPRSDAGVARDACAKAGVPVLPFSADTVMKADVVVDALLGTGLERDVEGEFHAAIETVNKSSSPVFSIDIPSGLHADTGHIMGAAVRADATMTFVGLKAGLFTGEGRTCAGAIYFDDLGVPQDVYDGIAPRAQRIRTADLAGLLPARVASAHKGDFGRVLIIGGNHGMAGACSLAALAAYRTGAGYVSVATRPEHIAAVMGVCPEALVHGVADAAALAPLLKHKDVVVVGPGLGQDNWARELFAAALDSESPMVVDADGLNLLATEPRSRPDWVLTPHPGEAGRLLGVSTSQVQGDRFASVEQLAQRFGGTCVLKGSGTLIRNGANNWLCDRGTPAMASAGMGDVLTGVIAALIGQRVTPPLAARAAVWLHAVAGEVAASGGKRLSVRASDLFDPLARQLSVLVDCGPA